MTTSNSKQANTHASKPVAPKVDQTVAQAPKVDYSAIASQLTVKQRIEKPLTAAQQAKLQRALDLAKANGNYGFTIDAKAHVELMHYERLPHASDFQFIVICKVGNAHIVTKHAHGVNSSVAVYNADMVIVYDSVRVSNKSALDFLVQLEVINVAQASMFELELAALKKSVKIALEAGNAKQA